MCDMFYGSSMNLFLYLPNQIDDDTVVITDINTILSHIEVGNVDFNWRLRPVVILQNFDFFSNRFDFEC